VQRTGCRFIECIKLAAWAWAGTFYNLLAPSSTFWHGLGLDRGLAAWLGLGLGLGRDFAQKVK